ncbi:MAG: hypothetical protein Q7T80_15370 [Methanoregula sp.]|nr:hypothetical protein [Methanoregula sp.]
MLSDFGIPHTMKIMALGHSLYDAECLAAIIAIECLVVYTIMGYRFSFGEQNEASGILSAPAVIHTGTREVAGSEAVHVDVLRNTPALLVQPA